MVLDLNLIHVAGILTSLCSAPEVQLQSEYVFLRSSDLSINKCILKFNSAPDEDQEVEEAGPQSGSLRMLNGI